MQLTPHSSVPAPLHDAGSVAVPQCFSPPAVFEYSIPLPTEAVAWPLPAREASSLNSRFSGCSAPLPDSGADALNMLEAIQTRAELPSGITASVPAAQPFICAEVQSTSFTDTNKES